MQNLYANVPTLNMKFQIVFWGSILARFETNLEITAIYMAKLFFVNLFGGNLRRSGGVVLGFDVFLRVRENLKMGELMMEQAQCEQITR